MDSKLKEFAPYSLMLFVFLATTGLLVAQENEDYSGTWAIVQKSSAVQGRCGQKITLAELEVTGEVPDTKKLTYEAMVTVWESSERCLTVTKDWSKAKLVVRETRVSLSYEAEDWGSEMLVRDGNTLAGIDANGTSLEWVRPGELPVSLQTAMVRQNIVNSMTETRLEKLQADIVADGKSAEEAEQLAPQLVLGFANCIVNVAQVQAAVQRLPLEELLKMYDPVSSDVANPRVVRRVDELAVEARTRACFYEVGEELGTQIL
jgi:hypothetical protein